MRLVVDLDGTLSRVNTFWYWTVASVVSRNPVNRDRHIRLLYTLFTLCFLRSVGRLSHSALKHRLLEAWCLVACDRPQQNAALNDAFAERIISHYCNANVLQLISRISGNEPTPILATAAPSLYAKAIARDLGMHCISTEVDCARKHLTALPSGECIRERKFERVKQELGNETYALITDHIDDALLINDATKVYLVRPSRRLVSHTRQHSNAVIELLD